MLARTVLAATALLAATGSAPAAAGHSAVVFEGTATISCFGCGPTTGSATLAIAGTVHGSVVIDGPATASFWASQLPSSCPINGIASGTVTGAVDLTFVWSRVGAVAVITTWGDIDGSGAATLVVTSPTGNPCGARAVRARFHGTIVGF